MDLDFSGPNYFLPIRRLQGVILFLRCVPTANWNRLPWKNHTSCNHYPYMVVVAIGIGTWKEVLSPFSLSALGADLLF